jgi:1,4-alpha-glucan branching enzyme
LKSGRHNKILAGLAAADCAAIVAGRHGQPFDVLGPHSDGADGCWVRVFLPGAAEVRAVDAAGGAIGEAFVLRHHEGLFEGRLPRAAARSYRLAVLWQSGTSDTIHDPYRFFSTVTAFDLWLLGQGTHARPYQVLGAEPCEQDDVAGTRFAVWAPRARRVSVVGDFNFWDTRRHPMRALGTSGFWELFLPGVGDGALYKYAILSGDGREIEPKADPYARRAELRPGTASIVMRLPPPVPFVESRRAANALDRPMSVYEVHLASWQRPVDDAHGFLSWDELGERLARYVAELGFTHVELLPVNEHPFDGSWGYQPTAMYAPTARFGDPAGFRRFVARLHAAGVGVIVDWVPAHFPADAHGLAQFDGAPLYEYADPREGVHRDWHTLIYDLRRPQVRNFLIGSALYFIERFGVDGLRVDAVASMLYRDYSRRPGEWLPNEHGGRENLEAIGFLRELNTLIGTTFPGAIMIAEESTAFPLVSKPPSVDGLGFHYKWNIGWMNDTLRYVSRPVEHRGAHREEISFGLMYTHSENYVLPVSHDEVVHGKRSLLGRMPGSRGEQFAHLRAYLGFMYAHPGRKLLFMGCEFAQQREWNHDGTLDWNLLSDDDHAGVQSLVRELNLLLRTQPALHAWDDEPRGFTWLDVAQQHPAVFAFLRSAPTGETALVVVNFGAETLRNYQVGVPQAGPWRIVLDTAGVPARRQKREFVARRSPAGGQACSLALDCGPLRAIFLQQTPSQVA